MEEENTPEKLAEQKSAISLFRDFTKGVFADKDKNVVSQVLGPLVRNLRKALDGIDKYLKNKNVDLGGAASKVKERSSNLIGSITANVKTNGVMDTFKKAKDKITGTITEKFKSDTETQGSPPEGKESKETDSKDNEDKDEKSGNWTTKLTSTMEGIRDKVKDFADTAKKLSKTQEENTGALKSLIDKTKDKAVSFREAAMSKAKAGYDKAKERSSKRQAEVEAERNALKESGKGGKEGGGFFGKLMKTLLGGVTGGISLAFKGLTFMLGKVIGPLIGKGITKTLGFLIPKIIPGIAGAIQSVAGMAGKAALGAAWGLGKGLIVGGAKALAGAATGVVSAVGLPAIAIAVAVGAVVFGGYKLYKYLNRNEVGKAPFAKLTRLRLLMYGYSDTRKEHYHKLFELEMMMQEFTVSKNKRAVIRPLSKEARENILKIFDVKRDDKPKYDIVNTWFANRFIPAYTSFMNALYEAREDANLESMDKLTNENIFTVASMFRTPTTIFDYVDVPTFEQTKTDVTSKDVEDTLVAIRGAIKEMLPEDKAQDKIKSDAKEAADKSRDAAEKKAQQAKRDSEIDTEARELPTIQKSTDNGVKDPNATPDSTEVKAKAEDDKAPSGSMPSMAAGPLQPGSKNLEGIQANVGKEAINALDPNLLDLLTGMAKEYNSITGKKIPVTSAARSKQDQERLYKKDPSKAAKPGSSLHEYGLAVDGDSKTMDELEKLGLMKKYGFTRPIGGEKWHIEPAGVSLNPGLAKSDPESRAKRILSSPGRGGGGYGAEDGTPMGKRNAALQMKLYEAGTTTTIDPAKKVENPVDVAAATPMVAAKDSMGAKEEVVAPTPKTSKEPTIQATAKPLDNPAAYVPERNANMDMGKVTDGTPDSPQAAIAKASKVVGVDEKTLTSFAKIESSMNPNAKNTAGSAKGLLQFTDATWAEKRSKYGSMYNIPADAQQDNPYYSAVLGAAYAKENLKSMGDVKSMGIREDTAMYLGHHFGASGGRKILEAYKINPEAPISSAVSPDAYNSNRQELGNKTVREYVEYLNGKIDKASGTTYPTSSGPSTTAAASTKPTETPKAQPQSTTPSVQGNADSGLYKPPPQTISQSKPNYDIQPQQPNAALSLGKTENLLTGMGDTLTAIKTILEAIRDKDGASMSSDKDKGFKDPSNRSKDPNDEGSDSASPQMASGSQALRVRSSYALSLSRKPQNV